MVEVLYIDGCPNHELTVERVKATLKDLGVAGELLEWAVNDPATASALRFLGSPTVRINGIDVEPSARTSNQFGLMCRTYLDGQRREGLPSIELIRRALLEASGQRQPE
jgi:hypothetical protein